MTTIATSTFSHGGAANADTVAQAAGLTAEQKKQIDVNGDGKFNAGELIDYEEAHMGACSSGLMDYVKAARASTNEGTVTNNGNGSYTIAIDGYKIDVTADSTVTITDRNGKKVAYAWGDPHLNTFNSKGQSGGQLDFKNDLTLHIAGGPTVTMFTKSKGGNDNVTYVDGVVVTEGNFAAEVHGLVDGNAQGSNMTAADSYMGKKGYFGTYMEDLHSGVNHATLRTDATGSYVEADGQKLNQAGMAKLDKGSSSSGQARTGQSDTFDYVYDNYKPKSAIKFDMMRSYDGPEQDEKDTSKTWTSSTKSNTPIPKVAKA